MPYVILEAIALRKKIIGPPNIPEFELHLPEWLLAETNASAIVAALAATWSRVGFPSYPLSRHAPDLVAREIVELYAHTVQRVAAGIG
ncbi:MAG TPA: hypothetical protein VL403_08705 [Candidatus Kryptonia bacterium]|nr:hypothetical protein [Candidatus Kryptonia bacterium]